MPVIRRFDLAACQRHTIMLNCGMTTNPSPLPPIAPTGFIGNREFIVTEWRFLLFGLLMAFWSSLGQTFFISLFSGQIRAALDLSHGDFGTYYALATTASAISLIWLGKLADMMRLEKLAIFILGSLCVAAVLFSQISSLWMLVGGLYLLRMFGQGMMTHVYTTAMARRYVVTRGRAISIAQLGHTLSESIGPASIVALQAIFDWRSLWISLPLIAFITLAPFLRLLTQRTRLQDGEGLDGLGANQPMPDHAYGGQKQWRRNEVLRDPAFWLGFIWLAAVPSFVLTGLLFHQIYLAEAKGVALSTWTASYVLYAVFAVIGSLTIGQLIDRFSARRVAAHMLLPNTLACLALWFGSAEIGVPLFFILFGLAIGMPHATNAALVAEVYGTRYMGEIKALFMPVGVFASALSPMLMGWMIDAGLGLDALLGMNIALAFGAQIMAMIVLHFRKAL
ncbi:MFS transporter [Candidatus Puniceispirillum sp.]|nr:MFS transporter [Candidatus Puniceispirillum sp.]